MKLSFGMIFSIILIIIFLAVAFYAIKVFLDMGNSVKVGKFVDGLQEDINKMWRSSQGSQDVSYTLSEKIGKVCFIDYSHSIEGNDAKIYNELKQTYYGSENLFFYPLGSGSGLDSTKIEHIDLEKSTQNENPLCFNNINGKINFKLEKNYGDSLVTVSRT